MSDVSDPLFDKMDALLARHRGVGSEIPVLLDEADDIPVLTEAVEELLPAMPVPAIEDAVENVAAFMDLPLLDLDALSQERPWANEVFEPLIEAEPLAPLMIKPEQVPEPDPAALSERAIAELSATVAAQLGVEIATEVEQLTRQHFASLMSHFYEEALQRLINEMSAEVENKLLPRVEALVKEELLKSGHG